MRKEDHCHGELDPTVTNPGLIDYPETRMPLRFRRFGRRTGHPRTSETSFFGNA